MARYDAGETLASIARTYDCSPPAISYVVSRSRARQPEPESLPKSQNSSEPQLVKAAVGEAVPATAPPVMQLPAADAAAASAAPAAAEAEEISPLARPEAAPAHDSAPDRQSPSVGNGAVRGNGAFEGAALRPDATVSQRPVAPPPNGDHRRTLHLSLGGARASEPHTAEPANPAQRAPAVAMPAERAGNGGEHGHGDPPHHNGGDAPPRRQNGAFIDHDLRARVEADTTAFLAAFDAALLNDTPESRSALREATDRLLRAGARTRIELERLEARLPLPARDAGGRGNPAWRDR